MKYRIVILLSIVAVFTTLSPQEAFSVPQFYVTVGDNDGQTISSQTGPVSVSSDFTSDNGSEKRSAFALADKGVLKVRGAASFNPGLNSGAGAQASWTDYLTISALGYGGTGIMHVPLSFSGSLSGSATPHDSYNEYGDFLGVTQSEIYSEGQFGISTSYAGWILSGWGQHYANSWSGSTDGSSHWYGNYNSLPSAYDAGVLQDGWTGTFLVEIPFTFGEEFSLTAYLRGNIRGYSLGHNGEGVASAAFDLGNSLYWEGITSITDADGNILPSYNVASESGHDWTRSSKPDINHVPEPATMLLLGLGLMGVAVIRRKLS